MKDKNSFPTPAIIASNILNILKRREFLEGQIQRLGAFLHAMKQPNFDSEVGFNVANDRVNGSKIYLDTQSFRDVTRSQILKSEKELNDISDKLSIFYSLIAEGAKDDA